MENKVVQLTEEQILFINDRFLDYILDYKSKADFSKIPENLLLPELFQAIYLDKNNLPLGKDFDLILFKYFFCIKTRHTPFEFTSHINSFISNNISHILEISRIIVNEGRIKSDSKRTFFEYLFFDMKFYDKSLYGTNDSTYKEIFKYARKYIPFYLFTYLLSKHCPELLNNTKFINSNFAKFAGLLNYNGNGYQVKYYDYRIKKYYSFNTTDIFDHMNKKTIIYIATLLHTKNMSPYNKNKISKLLSTKIVQ